MIKLLDYGLLKVVIVLEFLLIILKLILSLIACAFQVVENYLLLVFIKELLFMI